ncbi:MAG: N-6 DNA methylase [Spirochaetaceae bacterium]|jgi:predicted RNA methylase|nr:N-6 DNA methylase [Spirochaetaceae bacterium]
MGELTYREAADHLNVSPATINNWTRQGLLSSGSEHNLIESNIILLKNELSSINSNRLTSRANKSSAVRKFVPTEYIENRISRKAVNRLVEELKSIKVDHSVFLLCLSLKLIEQAGLIKKITVFSDVLPEIQHNKLTREITNWFKKLGKPQIKDTLKKISSMDIPLQRDTPGLIYQMLQSEGRKSEIGSYYTPTGYADEVLHLYGNKNLRFLDPCCGSGMFLLAAARKSYSPHNIHGWDTDETAVHLARINLMLYFKEIQFEPNVYHRNCLIEKTNKKYDLIATNPPWGHHFSKTDQKILREKYGIVKTGESFSYFIEAGLSLLSKKGILSYILPEALLKVKTHSDIRRDILKKAQIHYLKYLGKPFHRVQTEVIRMDLMLKKKKSLSTVFRENKIYSVDSKRFISNYHTLFDFNCNEKDYKIIEKMYAGNYQTLKQNTLWILGIVSGNNKKFISEINQKDFLPVICGLDLTAFQIKKPNHYINFDREVLQQSAPGEYYGKSPKITYKFITDKPVFAIDRSGLLTLNSANSFYPEIDIPVEVIVALFNSLLYRFLFRKKFNSIKILRNHLEQLPIPAFTIDQNKKIITLTKQLEQSEGHEYTQLRYEMDQLIFQYFNISDKDKIYILENI